MLGKFLDYLKTNLSEVGRVDAPLITDGNAPKVRQPGFPFSPDDKLTSYSDLSEFTPHSQKDFEQVQYDAANAPLDHASFEVSRGAW